MGYLCPAARQAWLPSFSILMMAILSYIVYRRVFKRVAVVTEVEVWIKVLLTEPMHLNCGPLIPSSRFLTQNMTPFSEPPLCLQTQGSTNNIETLHCGSVGKQQQKLQISILCTDSHLRCQPQEVFNYMMS